MTVFLINNYNNSNNMSWFNPIQNTLMNESTRPSHVCERSAAESCISLKTWGHTWMWKWISFTQLSVVPPTHKKKSMIAAQSLYFVVDCSTVRLDLCRGVLPWSGWEEDCRGRLGPFTFSSCDSRMFPQLSNCRYYSISRSTWRTSGFRC